MTESVRKASDHDEAWVRYKLDKVANLVARGYAVSYTSPANHWFRIVRRKLGVVDWKEARAEVKSYCQPSIYGIEGGRISKLRIWTAYRCGVGRFRPGQTLFEFERGPVLDQLKKDPLAKKMYVDLIAELN